MKLQQVNFSIRVRIPVADIDRPSAGITFRQAGVILRSAFKGALRKGKLDVTLWDSYGQCLAHYDCDPKPFKKQTVRSCFDNPLGR